MPVKTTTTKVLATQVAKRSAKRETRQAPGRTRTAHSSKGKEKQVVHRETFNGPNPMWKVYVEIPIRVSRPPLASNDSSCIVSAPLRKSGLKSKSMTKRPETGTSSASPQIPVRPRRVILKLNSRSSSSSNPDGTRSFVSSASTSSPDASIAAGPSRPSSDGGFAIDPDELAQSLDQYDEKEDPQSFETLVIPSRSPDTEKKSFYIGDGCDPRAFKKLKRKRSSEDLSTHNLSDTNTPKRSKLFIRLPVRRPPPIENAAPAEIMNSVPRQSSGGKELSRVLELVQTSQPVSDLAEDDDVPILEDITTENTTRDSTTKETTELCAMCASWKKALGSPGRLEFLAPAAPEECERCQEKASEKSTEVEASNERPELSLELPPSFTRASDSVDAIASPLEGPEALDEALLLEEARAAMLDSSAPPERTPSLSSTRSSISLGAADHPDIDLNDFELGYPESFEPSPVSSPHPHILELQAEFTRCIEHYYEQANAWAAAHAQAEMNSDLRLAETELKDKYVATEDVTTLSNSFQNVVGLSSDSESVDSNDSDVNMSDWLSNMAVSSSTAVQV